MNEGLKEKALKHLLYKMRSEKEMRLFLKEKHDAQVEEIEEIIAYLYSYNYLDDEKYAIAFIKDKLNFSPIGRVKMRYELVQKGIESESIDFLLEDYYPFENEIAVAKKLLSKKGRMSYDESKNKRYLYSKGFSNTAIDRVFD